MALGDPRRHRQHHQRRLRHLLRRPWRRLLDNGPSRNLPSAPAPPTSNRPSRGSGKTVHGEYRGGPPTTSRKRPQSRRSASPSPSSPSSAAASRCPASVERLRPGRRALARYRPVDLRLHLHRARRLRRPRRRTPDRQDGRKVVPFMAIACTSSAFVVLTHADKIAEIFQLILAAPSTRTPPTAPSSRSGHSVGRQARHLLQAKPVKARARKPPARRKSRTPRQRPRASLLGFVDTLFVCSGQWRSRSSPPTPSNVADPVTPAASSRSSSRRRESTSRRKRSTTSCRASAAPSSPSPVFLHLQHGATAYAFPPTPASPTCSEGRQRPGYKYGIILTCVCGHRRHLHWLR